MDKYEAHPYWDHVILAACHKVSFAVVRGEALLALELNLPSAHGCER